MTREFTDDMHHIITGPYEDTCKQMILAGLDWFDANPNGEEPQFAATFTPTGSVVAKDNDSAQQLLDVMRSVNTSAPSSVLRTAVAHMMLARVYGWDTYCRIQRGELEKQIRLCWRVSPTSRLNFGDWKPASARGELLDTMRTLGTRGGVRHYIEERYTDGTGD